MKQFFLIYIFSTIPPLIIYLISIYGFDNCDVHLGCFGLFSVFSIYVLVWGLLGGAGFIIFSVLTKSSVKGRVLPYKYLATLGLLIGASHFIVQLNIENFLVILPVPILLSWFCSSVLFHLSAKQV
ncbi:hypothetical protein [Pseudoalteromonas phenolica]|uniref:hypothetical protein n=1 Tax=Pseudoalteromonas phenolica TaxID=161398 RepID=UPI00102A9911|nr:hypothetical protein [Pseudoalteromonas phenolica]